MIYIFFLHPIYIYIYIYSVCTHICSGIILFFVNVDGLVCLVLWHINLCRLFNAKSIFM